MGLFSRNYNTPGPGVSPDEPRKKGFARLFELIARDVWPIFKAGFLAFLSALPFVFLLSLSIITHALLFVLIAGLLGGMLVGPQLTGLADTILRSLRDEPGYWWETYKRAWKRNAKASLLPGAVFGLIFAIQIFTVYHLSSLSMGISTLIILFVGALLSLGLSNYVWPQIALLDLPFGGMLKNMVLLFMGYLPRSAGAMLVQVVYWGAFLLFFPLTSILLPLTGFWVPMLLATFIIYPPLNKSFDIENGIKKIREKQMNPDPLPEENAWPPVAQTAGSSAADTPADDGETDDAPAADDGKAT